MDFGLNEPASSWDIANRPTPDVSSPADLHGRSAQHGSLDASDTGVIENTSTRQEQSDMVARKDYGNGPVVDCRAKPERRGRDRRQLAFPVKTERRKPRERRVERRRQIDPTTCERDYTEDEVEFMKAMDRYKRESGRPFPTWSEVLEVLLALGYSRPPKTEAEQK